MSYFKTLFDFYINSSIHVALAAYSLTWITLIEYNLEYDESYLYFVFYATIVAYNFVKYFGLVKYHYRQYAKSLKAIGLMSLFAAVGMAYYALKLDAQVLVLVVVLGGVTFFYAIPILPKHILYDKQHNLRQISGVKIYVIATVWALTTVLGPALNNSIALDSILVITIIQRFLFVFVLMLPFEIRDLKFDSLKLATIPQQIGIKNTKNLGIVLLVFFFCLEFMKSEVNPSRLFVVSLVTLLTLLFLLFAKIDQSKYYSSFWVEGIPIVWLVLLLVLT